MPAPGTTAPKKDRREAAREAARIQREAEKKRQRRNRIFLQGGIGIGILAVIAVIVLIVVNVQPKPVGPGPLNMRSDGIVLSGPDMKAVSTPAIPANGKPVATKRTDDPVQIVTYVDYQCPFCEQFETANEDQIATWVKAGEATLEIHPISFLDNSSLGNKYSTRAANAAACVANYDPDDFYAVNTALYANQPAENTNGKTDAELISVLKGAGASSSKISDCVKSQEFVPWVTASTGRLHINSSVKVLQGVANTPVPFAGTPTVFVNGVQYQAPTTGQGLGDAGAFAAFVAQQSNGAISAG